MARSTGGPERSSRPSKEKPDTERREIVKRFKYLVLIAVGLALVALGAGVNSVAPALAQEVVQFVQVVNRDDQPVPVKVQGRAAVAVTNEPTVHFAPGSVVGLAEDHNTVQVVNSVGDLLQVNLFKVPWQDSTATLPAGPKLDMGEFFVPGNKRFIIEHVSGQGFVSEFLGLPMELSLLTSINGQPPVQHYLTPNWQLDKSPPKHLIFTVGEPVQLYHDTVGGARVRIFWKFLGSENTGRALTLTVSGYLVGLP
jgi:hypothetical protein